MRSPESKHSSSTWELLRSANWYSSSSFSSCILSECWINLCQSTKIVEYIPFRIGSVSSTRYMRIGEGIHSMLELPVFAHTLRSVHRRQQRILYSNQGCRGKTIESTIGHAYKVTQRDQNASVTNDLASSIVFSPVNTLSLEPLVIGHNRIRKSWIEFFPRASIQCYPLLLCLESTFWDVINNAYPRHIVIKLPEFVLEFIRSTTFHLVWILNIFRRIWWQ